MSFFRLGRRRRRRYCGHFSQFLSGAAHKFKCLVGFSRDLVRMLELVTQDFVDVYVIDARLGKVLRFWEVFYVFGHLRLRAALPSGLDCNSTFYPPLMWRAT